MVATRRSLSIPNLEDSCLLCIRWERTVLLTLEASVSEAVAIVTLIAHATSTLGATAENGLVRLATISTFCRVHNSGVPR